MCLVVKNPKIRIAKRDLVFYKVMERSGTFGLYHTLFNNTDKYYPLNETIYNRDNISLNINIVSSKRGCFNIKGGFFHLFKTKKAAQELLERGESTWDWEMLKAIVPKGAFYIKGDDDTVVTDTVIYKKL